MAKRNESDRLHAWKYINRDHDHEHELSSTLPSIKAPSAKEKEKKDKKNSNSRSSSCYKKNNVEANQHDSQEKQVQIESEIKRMSGLYMLCTMWSLTIAELVEFNFKFCKSYENTNAKH